MFRRTHQVLKKTLLCTELFLCLVQYTCSIFGLLFVLCLLCDVGIYCVVYSLRGTGFL